MAGRRGHVPPLRNAYARARRAQDALPHRARTSEKAEKIVELEQLRHEVYEPWAWWTSSAGQLESPDPAVTSG